MTDDAHKAGAGMTDRLAAAARTLTAARQAVADALETRDRLIVEAVDAGLSIRAVGRHAGVSDSAVTKVLTTAGRFAH